MADLDAASGPGAGRAGHRGRATGIVLAGGRSSRFGRDKLAERLDDRPLLAHVVERVARACREVLVVVPPGGRTAGAPVAEVPDAAGPRAAGAADFGASGAVGFDASPTPGSWAGAPTGRPRIRLVEDPEPYGGPLVGIVAGLEAAGEPLALIVPGDRPLVEPAVLGLLVGSLASVEDWEAAALRSLDRVEPLPCAVRVGAALPIARHLVGAGDTSVRGLLASLRTLTVDEAEWRALDPAAGTLVDVDRPADLESIRARSPPGPVTSRPSRQGRYG